jgi:hypothetical protein
MSEGPIYRASRDEGFAHAPRGEKSSGEQVRAIAVGMREICLAGGVRAATAQSERRIYVRSK